MLGLERAARLASIAARQVQMSSTILVSVLGAAFLHALWNAFVRGAGSGAGGSRAQVMMVLSGIQGLIGLGLLCFYPWPPAAVWPWLLTGGLIHSAYKLSLTRAYAHGDLSRVYPLARGTAPLIVLALSAALLNEVPNRGEVAGLVILGAGILLLASGVFTAGENRALLPFAFAAALATAGYTMVDGQGARVWGLPGAFVAWMFLLDGIFFATAMLAIGGRSVLPTSARIWRLGFGGALASYASYAVAVWAMTRAPIALVAGLRESSVAFGLLIGWLWFSEPMTKGKALSVAMIVGGIALMRLQA